MDPLSVCMFIRECRVKRQTLCRPLSALFRVSSSVLTSCLLSKGLWSRVPLPVNGNRPPKWCRWRAGITVRPYKISSQFCAMMFWDIFLFLVYPNKSAVVCKQSLMLWTNIPNIFIYFHPYCALNIRYLQWNSVNSTWDNSKNLLNSNQVSWSLSG